MAKGDLSWSNDATLQPGDVFEQGGKTFEVIYVWWGAKGPIFGKPGVPNNQYVPRKVRVKEL